MWALVDAQIFDTTLDDLCGLACCHANRITTPISSHPVSVTFSFCKPPSDVPDFSQARTGRVASRFMTLSSGVLQVRLRYQTCWPLSRHDLIMLQRVRVRYISVSASLEVAKHDRTLAQCPLDLSRPFIVQDFDQAVGELK